MRRPAAADQTETDIVVDGVMYLPHGRGRNGYGHRCKHRTQLWEYKASLSKEGRKATAHFINQGFLPSPATAFFHCGNAGPNGEAARY